MFDFAAISQFYPGNSFIHRLDPRTKVLIVVAYSILIFIPRGPWGLGLIAALLLLAIGAAQVRITLLFKGLRPIIFLLFITMGLNSFLTPGEPIWSYGMIQVTREGLVQGSFVTVRLILLIVFTSLLTMTTSPIALTDALERLFRPLAGLGFPATDVALMMSIALRFIPTLLSEAERIIKAQEARGLRLREGNIAYRIQAIVPVLVPLFVAAFRRADELAVAMEARGYRGGRRTRLRELRFSRPDLLAGWLVTAFTLGVLWLRWVGNG